MPESAPESANVTNGCSRNLVRGKNSANNDCTGDRIAPKRLRDDLVREGIWRLRVSRNQMCSRLASCT